MRMLPARLATIALVVAGCAGASSPAVPTATQTPVPTAVADPGASASPSAPSPTSSAEARVARWRDAIAAVLPGLERLHPEPFHGTPRATFETALAELDATAATADDDELLAGLMRVFALVSAGGRDAHTGLYAWGSGTYPLHAIPVQVWLFDERPRIVAAPSPHEELVGARIETVAGRPVADVLDRLEPLVPRDNDATVRLLLPRFLVLAEALHGVGVTTDAEAPVALGIVDASGARRVVDVDPVPMAEYNAWAGPYGLFLPADPRVLARSRPDPALWTATPAPGVVYVGYQSLDGVDRAALDELTSRLTADGVRAVVVDVRRNTGGEYRAIDTVLHPILVATDGPGAPAVWVLTGRNTFSGGSLFVARLAAARDVTIAGETMSGSPNTWADPEALRLGDTGLEAQVSTTFDVGGAEDDDRLAIEPDVPVTTTWADVAAGRDPVLDAVLAAVR